MRKTRMFLVALALAMGMALSFSATAVAKEKTADKCGFVCKCKKNIAKMKDKHKAGNGKSCGKKKNGNETKP